MKKQDKRVTQKRPDPAIELEGLKDFQMRSVERVHERFWDPKDPVRRFLVADEVGLGKTLVARGVIARAIDQLWDTVDRIDIVYICSNTQIARQNVPKLRIGGSDEHHHADRLTLLATELGSLQGRRVNFVSFTPGTSFNPTGGGGNASERVLLYWLLREAWGAEMRAPYWLRMFRGKAGFKSFKRQVDAFDRSSLPPKVSVEFSDALKSLPGPRGGTLVDEIRECVEGFKHKSNDWSPPYDLGAWRYQLVGRLRQALARMAVKALEPDLVILDEFQRFKDLMHGDGEGAELARELFEHDQVRLMLLSATPYKMYTLPEEPEGDDHYRDFVDTVRFLAGDARALNVESDLSLMRAGLYSGDFETAQVAKDRVQSELRRVMTRTERLASTPDRDGMIGERTWSGLELTASDVRDYRRLQHASKVLKGQDPMEFWRSSPFVLELMDGYKVKQKLLDHDPSDTLLIDALRSTAGLRWSDVLHYRKLDPSNAKMRGLVSDVLDRGAWQLAWIPPSMPYYELAGAYADPALAAFTKRLIFSSWAVAPKAIGTVVSYEAERRINAEASARTTSRALERYDATRPTGLLSFQSTAGRLTGMPVLGWLYPCVTWARVGDPLMAARELGAPLPLTRPQFEAYVREEVVNLLDSLPSATKSGSEDAAWYWATGILLDRLLEVEGDEVFRYGFYVDEDGVTDRRFVEHVERAVNVTVEELGRRPADLVEVLVAMAIGGPGPAALRALSRVCGGDAALGSFEVRNAASCVAWSMRNLFNRPETMALVRGKSGKDAYWLDVLRHAVDGGLQSVLDEYVHVLNEALGMNNKPAAEAALGIARAIDDAMSVRTSVQSFTDIGVRAGRVKMSTHRTRSHFAVRFGRGVAEDEKNVMREGQVRAAFNSPFWPFVLASTSVGQEGLDFHHYSHAIVHWNLPSNPVDLEQREGRVHRYKGHAVRKNLAAIYMTRPEIAEATDPWEAVFELAAADRPAGESEIYPYWIGPLGGAARSRIERYVPTLPLSKETHAYRRLLRTVAAYRLVVGQPRQEDLLRYLGDRVEDLDSLRIDLAP